MPHRPALTSNFKIYLEVEFSHIQYLSIFPAHSRIVEQPQADVKKKTGEQVIFGTNNGRTQPRRELWKPGPKGDYADKLKGFNKGQTIALGGISGNDGESERILYDSNSEVSRYA